MSVLYIVATPLGNLQDISLRALEVLKTVQVIAAEDTRHARKLLQHYGIKTPLVSHHEHNERKSASHLIPLLKAGQSVALISDAGTPCISDPGYHLVKAASDANIVLVPVPGACAAIAALSVSGLPSDHFVFEGFLPATSTARRSRLMQLFTETRTLIFYEAPHRIEAMLSDVMQIFGEERNAMLGRELTKTFETIYHATLKALCDFVKKDVNQRRGECVIVVEGISKIQLEHHAIEKARQLLKMLLEDLPLKKAVKITAEICSVSKNFLYEEALALQGIKQKA